MSDSGLYKNVRQDLGNRLTCINPQDELMTEFRKQKCVLPISARSVDKHPLQCADSAVLHPHGVHRFRYFVRKPQTYSPATYIHHTYYQ